MLRAHGVADAALGRMTVGQRDALLMDLRANAFGVQVASVADCPACSERMDVTFDLREIRTPPAGNPLDTIEVKAEGYTISARPPTVDDLLWLDRCGPETDLQAELLERCVLVARHKGRTVSTATIPASVVTRIAGALSAADPQAEVLLTLKCPACGHTWSAPFDIVSYFWQELETWVWRTARDVDRLASRYGWSEAEILTMSPDRRALYLEMVYA